MGLAVDRRPRQSARVVLLVGVRRWSSAAPREPVLPPRLFAQPRLRGDRARSGFVVGFALFGSVTYLPLFLQVVKGASPTGSGLQLLPLMGGLLITSIGSGQVITRTGRYKPFPIAGTAVMIVGLFLLSTHGPVEHHARSMLRCSCSCSASGWGW